MRESKRNNVSPLSTRLRIVEEENHRLVIHTSLHETRLEIFMPLYRPVILGDFDLRLCLGQQ